jgi:uncharacterized protein (TIGR03084 family)
VLDLVLADLAAESDDLDRTVAGLSDLDFSRPTPAAGWTIAHQIAHLAWTDTVTYTAVTDPDAFAAQLAAVAADPLGYLDRAAAAGVAPPAELLPRWRDGRADLARALRETTAERIPWFGTSMSPTSVATARLMETWAHGQDVADTLGRRRGYVPRLRHIAHLGHRTLGHSFAMHGYPVPEAAVRLELSTPDGALWTFGPDEATDRVVGPALDFCLLVTQRRHPADLALQANGPVAEEWMQVAQAFAGPPGAKRQPARQNAGSTEP